MEKLEQDCKIPIKFMGLWCLSQSKSKQTRSAVRMETADPQEKMQEDVISARLSQQPGLPPALCSASLDSMVWWLWEVGLEKRNGAHSWSRGETGRRVAGLVGGRGRSGRRLWVATER